MHRTSIQICFAARSRSARHRVSLADTKRGHTTFQHDGHGKHYDDGWNQSFGPGIVPADETVARYGDHWSLALHSRDRALATFDTGRISRDGNLVDGLFQFVFLMIHHLIWHGKAACGASNVSHAMELLNDLFRDYSLFYKLTLAPTFNVRPYHRDRARRTHVGMALGSYDES
jgi:hypothetical protein